MNAVKLIAMLSGIESDFSQRIETSIQTETNPLVLAASIDALNTTKLGEISALTLNSISDHLLYNNDPLVQGKALEALTQLQHYDENVQQYIQRGLDSDSIDLQLSSMLSLDNLLNVDEEYGNSQIPAVTLKRITEIANNTELPADVRMQALSLMNTHMDTN